MKSDLLSRIALAVLLCFGLVLTGCYDDSALRDNNGSFGLFFLAFRTLQNS